MELREPTESPTDALGTERMREIAEEWIAALNVSLRSDSSSLGELFVVDSWWRDQLTFGWDLRTTRGREHIIDRMTQVVRTSTAPHFHAMSDFPAEHVTTPSGRSWIQFGHTFETELAHGQGVVRLIRDYDDQFRAWTLSTGMVELKGFEAKAGVRRPEGVVHGPRRDPVTWSDRVAAKADVGSRELDLVIVGAGQAGLSLAAEASQLGLDALVVERNARIGDSWRNRYKSLVLHDPVHSNHLPYLPFPTTWPLWTPKDKLADWFESYATTLDLTVWTSSTIQSAKWNSTVAGWTLVIKRADGKIAEVTTKHLAMATGQLGRPKSPRIEGAEAFLGEIAHSNDFDAARGYSGKSVVVLGASNSAFDLAHDLASNDAAVTIVQRSHTYVMSSKSAFGVLHKGVFGEELGTARGDLLSASMPLNLAFELEDEYGTELIAAGDREMLRGLEVAGLKLNKVEGVGRLSRTRVGGFYIDVGAAQAIIDGDIKVKQGVEIDHLEADSVVYTDGSSQTADVLVYATGYGNMIDVARDILGSGVTDACKPVGGIDEQGETSSLWRESGVDGLWFMAGSLTLSRQHAKLLAFQILARVHGLVPGSTK